MLAYVKNVHAYTYTLKNIGINTYRIYEIDTEEENYIEWTIVHFGP